MPPLPVEEKPMSARSDGSQLKQLKEAPIHGPTRSKLYQMDSRRSFGMGGVKISEISLLLMAKLTPDAERTTSSN